jgi:hypothetical protein
MPRRCARPWTRSSAASSNRGSPPA